MSTKRSEFINTEFEYLRHVETWIHVHEKDGRERPFVFGWTNKYEDHVRCETIQDAVKAKRPRSEIRAFKSLSSWKRCELTAHDLNEFEIQKRGFPVYECRRSWSDYFLFTTSLHHKD